MIALVSPDYIPGDMDQLSFRWIHFLAGVLWIGILYFFNWVNTAFAPTMDAETKKKVVPELMPRALFWFRWGAAVTWLSGVYLLMKLYYVNGGNLFSSGSELAGTKPEFSQWIMAFAALIVGFLIYDILFKLLAKQHAIGVILWGAIAIGFAYWLVEMQDFSARAMYIHIGALFGTSMAANVWMRIWPAQRRIITAIKNGQAPAPADPAMAGLRSKHNTYMSVPLLLYMVSVHQEGMLGVDKPYIFAAGVLVIGFLVTYLIYKSVPNVKGF